MIERIFCIVLLITAIGLFLEYDRADTEREELRDSLVAMRASASADSVELVAARWEAQCYHEECVHLAFEYMAGEPDTTIYRYLVDVCDTIPVELYNAIKFGVPFASDTGMVTIVNAGRTKEVIDTVISYTYTIPCDGRRVEIGGR